MTLVYCFVQMFQAPETDEPEKQESEEEFFNEPRSSRGTYQFQTKRETRNASVSVKR